jgi:hypothetical protein
MQKAVKWIFLVSGAIIALAGLTQSLKIIAYIGELTEMGKGYLTGSILLVIVGVALVIFGLKIGKKSKKSD